MTVILFSLGLRPACSNSPFLPEFIYSDVYQAEQSLNTSVMLLCSFPSLCISVLFLFVLFIGKISSSHDRSINAQLILSPSIVGFYFFLLYLHFMPDLLLCSNIRDLDLHSALTSTREIHYGLQNLLIFLSASTLTRRYEEWNALINKGLYCAFDCKRLLLIGPLVNIMDMFVLLQLCTPKIYLGERASVVGSTDI